MLLLLSLCGLTSLMHLQQLHHYAVRNDTAARIPRINEAPSPTSLQNVDVAEEHVQQQQQHHHHHQLPLKSRHAMNWETVAEQLMQTDGPRYVIVDAKNGLGNRLRALCSGMSVAASLHRPVLLIWVPDVHCNCSFANLYQPPLPFALLEQEIPLSNLSAMWFQRYNCAADVKMMVEPTPHSDVPFVGHARASRATARGCVRA